MGQDKLWSTTALDTPWILLYGTQLVGLQNKICTPIKREHNIENSSINQSHSTIEQLNLALEDYQNFNQHTNQQIWKSLDSVDHPSLVTNSTQEPERIWTIGGSKKTVKVSISINIEIDLESDHEASPPAIHCRLFCSRNLSKETVKENSVF